MKKVLGLLSVFTVISSLTMAGDFTPGTYKAAKEASHRGGFNYTNFVVMEVDESGDIESLYLDATFPVDTKDLSKGFSTKQIMGDSYGMRAASPIEKEWDEQADAIAAHVVANQEVAFKVNEDKTTDAIAGATVKVQDYAEIIEDVISQAKM